MMKKDEINRYPDIPGWLADEEGELLYRLAMECKDGEIVEIGSWKGKSTVWLAEGSRAGRGLKIHAIDPHKGYDGKSTLKEFKDNIARAGVGGMIIPVVKTSEEAAKGFSKPVGLIFIDGSHEYNDVKKDFELWFPRLVDGGVMAFHDTLGYDGPRRLVNELVYKSRSFRNVRLVNNITYAVKAENTFPDRLRNRLSLLIKRLREMAIRKKG
ncbi:MAG: class I SAM-dependent methyltransferase [Candidatus Aenigmarchaeota archaeon]|nr:class I SAM-dependent methyltransferase [Candidatus Aenigmarchaeota archaeon]